MHSSTWISMGSVLQYLVFFGGMLGFVAVLNSIEVEAKTQRLGDKCNWTQNCQAWVEGAGPGWANNKVTCAVPQQNKPETCTNNKDNRNDFHGICKAVGTLIETEYGCECGVHKGDCQSICPFNRLFHPQDWIKDAWDKFIHQ